MRGGPVRIALYALLVLVFLLLPPSDPAVASSYDPPIIDADDLDQDRPEFPRQLNAPPNVRIDNPDHGQEYLVGDGIVMVFSIVDTDDSEWLLKWEVSGLTNGYEKDIPWIYVDTGYTYTLSGVPVGEYHLTVYARDMEYQAAASVEFMVVSEYTELVSEGSPWWYWACCITTFIVIVPISYYLVKRRQAGVERTRAARIRPTAGGSLTTSPPPRTSYPQVYQRPPLPPPLPKQVPPTTPAPYPMGSGKAEPPPAYAPRGIEQPPPPPPQPPPPPPPPPRAPTPAAVEDWRVGSVEEFVELIEDLPEGFPEPLWGIDWWTLGREAVRTAELRSDGLPVCTVNGKQFHADKRDMDTFMQEV